MLWVNVKLNNILDLMVSGNQTRRKLIGKHGGYLGWGAMASNQYVQTDWIRSIASYYISFEYLFFRSLNFVATLLAMGPSKMNHSTNIPKISIAIAMMNICKRNEVGIRWSNSNRLNTLVLNNSQLFNPQRNKIIAVNIRLVQRYLLNGFPLLNATAQVIYSKFPMRKVTVFSIHFALSSNSCASDVTFGTNQGLPRKWLTKLQQ